MGSILPDLHIYQRLHNVAFLQLLVEFKRDHKQPDM